MKFRVAALAVLGALLVLASAIAAAIAFGGPSPAPPLPSIEDPFKAVDFSDLPPLERYAARDGERLAYRRYGAGDARDSVVLIHGSSASSSSMHVLAKALARAGHAVYALDMRGHGESGSKGTIAYIGQLEDDLEDFVNTVKPAGRKTLVGFSSGGGFALRFAADRRQRMFDGYLLLAPFLHQEAPTYRHEAGWVAVGVPRFVGLAILNRLGVTRFDDLPVMTFALGDDDRRLLTPWYSYALADNFRPHDDYKADIRNAKQPMAVLAGGDDELFFPDRFASVFSDAGRPVRVVIVPGVGHIGVTLSPAALPAVVSSVGTLAAPPR